MMNHAQRSPAIVTRADLANLTGLSYDVLRKGERLTGLFACRVRCHGRAVYYSTARLRALAWWRQIFPDGDPL